MGLEVQGLGVRRGARRVIEEVSFALAPGEIVVLVGANGAGKTTLLEALAGLLRHDGRVSWAGAPLSQLRDRVRTISYLRDEAEPPAEVTVATLIAHARRVGASQGALADRLEDELGLRGLRRARAGALSRGERKRVQLFTALCADRPLLLLDEPLGTFDPLQLLSVLELLRERARAGTALLLSVHQMSDAEKIATRVLVLDAGRVRAQGKLEALRADVALPGASLEAVVVELLRRARAAA